MLFDGRSEFQDMLLVERDKIGSVIQNFNRAIDLHTVLVACICIFPRQGIALDKTPVATKWTILNRKICSLLFAASLFSGILLKASAAYPTKMIGAP